MRRNHFAATTLRWGLAFVFFYFGISTLLAPRNQLWEIVFSVYSLVLAVWLFVGWRLAIVSLFACATFIIIVLFNLPNILAVFKDIGLALSAMALYELSKSDASEE